MEPKGKKERENLSPGARHRSDGGVFRIAEATRERLHRWVESYVSAHPSVCSRRNASGGDAGGPRFVVRVIGDRVHRIESQVFDSHTIQARQSSPSID